MINKIKFIYFSFRVNLKILNNIFYENSNIKINK